MTENGAYVYQKGNPVDTWTADDLSFYGTELSQAYEAMFREYGEDFERFSWKVYDGKRTGTGERTESRSTGNGETVVQLFGQNLQQLIDRQHGIIHRIAGVCCRDLFISDKQERL